MVTFVLLPESYALITGETGRTIHRQHGLTIGGGGSISFGPSPPSHSYGFSARTGCPASQAFTSSSACP